MKLSRNIMSDVNDALNQKDADNYINSAKREQEKREKHLYPLRLNHKTIIYVKKSKCNELYAEEARQRLGISKYG